jgi:hypothetical protein
MAIKTKTSNTSGFAPEGALENYHTLDGLLTSHALEACDIPLLGYPVTGISDFEEHTAKDLDSSVDAAVARYRSLGLELVVRARPQTCPTIYQLFSEEKLN